MDGHDKCYGVGQFRFQGSPGGHDSFLNLMDLYFYHFNSFWEYCIFCDIKSKLKRLGCCVFFFFLFYVSLNRN